MVYIVNNKGQNFEAAKIYGNFKDITSGPQPVFDSNEMDKRIRRGLEEFDPRKDYVLCVGPSWLLMKIAHFLSHTKVQYLVFDSVNQSYKVQILGGM